MSENKVEIGYIPPKGTEEDTQYDVIDADIVDVADRLGDLQIKIKALQEVEEALKQELRDRLVKGTYKLPDYKLEVQSNRRIDEKRAIETYGEKVCKVKWDAATAKKVLSGDQYEELYNENKPKILLTYEG